MIAVDVLFRGTGAEVVFKVTVGVLTVIFALMVSPDFVTAVNSVVPADFPVIAPADETVAILVFAVSIFSNASPSTETSFAFTFS